MTTHRSAALAVLLTGLAGGPALAATCSMTVLGTPVLDDATCAVGTARGVTRVTVEDGSTILVRRAMMTARLAGDPLMARRGRVRPTAYGQVVTSSDSDDKTCFFNQKAVLCIAP